MSVVLLTRIQEAEAKAEQVRQQAQQDAREMIKSVEEAALATSRAAAIEHRELSSAMLSETAAQVERQIAQNRAAQTAQRDAMREQAMGRLAKVSATIFERVVNDGHR